MNKNEFLTELRTLLKRLPKQEIDNAISYYDEYIDDAGEQIIAELNLSEIASKIIGEYTVNNAQQKSIPKLSVLWIALLAIFASPIAFPIALTIVIVAVVLIFTLFIVLFSFFVSAIAVIISGIGAAIFSFAFVIDNFAKFLVSFGVGLLILCLGTALLISTYSLSKITFLGLQKLLGKFLVRRGTK